MAQGRFRSAPTKHFISELKRMRAHVKARVLLAVEELVSNPFAGIRLRGELDGHLRWRTSDYRIIYKIDEEKHLVVLLDVGPRKAIYD
jgi:mRNA interferase RelE/StbE